MSDRQKFERFLWFHGQIKSGKYPNAPHLAEAFEISGRTAQRDVEFMRDRLDAPFAYDHFRRGYRYTDTFYELPGHWISETNVLALALAVRLASTIPDPALKDELCCLINRVVNTSGGTGESCIDRVGDKISVKNIEYARVDEQIFRQTVQALFEDQALQITYHSPHTAKTSSRTIQPLHLMHYMGSWYLLAWCATSRAIRDFALSRLQAIEPSPDPVQLPANLPPIKEYTRKHFGIMQGHETIAVALRFSPKISPWLAEQIWHPQQKVTTEPDGSLLLEFPAADFRELVKIILSHGAEVQVVEPPELRILVREEIERMTKIYLSV
ncbi:MAG: WYL domain-containing protein [Desulfoprunum sp.]|nr:WYL domain-containing protein [Desulfoprunum sp.]